MTAQSKLHSGFIASLARKYRVTSWFYDVLDYPWERQYRQWRPHLLKNVEGEVLEAGVGTGRNLKHYPTAAHVTGVDLSPEMLRVAKKRARKSACSVTLLQQDALHLSDLPSNHFDWYIATFLYCVLPDELQPRALEEMIRVLKPGGRFKLLEIVYSKEARLRRRQEFLAPLAEKLYGARFDRHTLEYLREKDQIKISRTRYLKADTYLFIEGRKKPS
ncbi:class I SAM-dependent methyltransferase [Candidatus Peregrinibacteria bacterium CG10_big_fil_rev_8_21_14_0_10_49_10]|nr:MAG: class I SAM-dependent methyltransferase [Candidatus Peregrinibacteria bacterium CG10_big_fil_rev_8_21_14_0_10_49_10]